MLRDIIQIDAEKCTGCGACLTHCAENALALIDGKAKLVRDMYCDGLGACLGTCPEGALTIIQREAAPFDETQIPQSSGTAAAAQPHATAQNPAGGCSGSKARTLAPLEELAVTKAATTTGHHASMLRTWPVQLRLLPANAPFLRDAHLLLAADCAGFAMRHMEELLRGRVLLIACPKLDDAAAHARKLAEICRTAQPSSITILRMSVPCCSGLEHLTEAALRECGMAVPVTVEQVDVR